jgi:hypothetical protein
MHRERSGPDCGHGRRRQRASRRRRSLKADVAGNGDVMDGHLMGRHLMDRPADALEIAKPLASFVSNHY